MVLVGQQGPALGIHGDMFVGSDGWYGRIPSAGPCWPTSTIVSSTPGRRSAPASGGAAREAEPSGRCPSDEDLLADDLAAEPRRLRVEGRASATEEASSLIRSTPIRFFPESRTMKRAAARACAASSKHARKTKGPPG